MYAFVQMKLSLLRWRRQQLAPCNQQHGNQALKSVRKNQSQLCFNIGNSKKRKSVLFFVACLEEWGVETSGLLFSIKMLATCRAATMLCGTAAGGGGRGIRAVLSSGIAVWEVPINPVILLWKNGRSGFMLTTLRFLGAGQFLSHYKWTCAAPGICWTSGKMRRERRNCCGTSQQRAGTRKRSQGASCSEESDEDR